MPAAQQPAVGARLAVVVAVAAAAAWWWVPHLGAVLVAPLAHGCTHGGKPVVVVVVVVALCTLLQELVVLS